MSGLLYGQRQPRLISEDHLIERSKTDFVGWAKSNPGYIDLLPDIPPTGHPSYAKSPHSAKIILESNVIYRPPAANECSGVVALGPDAEGELLVWGLLYWGPARGGHAQRRRLYRGHSIHHAAEAINNELAYRVHNDNWYSEGPLRPLSVDQLILPRGAKSGAASVIEAGG